MFTKGLMRVLCLFWIIAAGALLYFEGFSTLYYIAWPVAVTLMVGSVGSLLEKPWAVYLLGFYWGLMLLVASVWVFLQGYEPENLRRLVPPAGFCLLCYQFLGEIRKEE